MPETQPPAQMYRRSGEIETQLDIERLPPTPISDAAREKLLSWDLTERHIEQIREFCASFRYDRCLEKIERQASFDAFLLPSDNGLRVHLPNFMDPHMRFDGQCGDIARNVVAQASFSGLLHDLNEDLNLPDGMRIVISYCTGQSATHFNREGSTHVWNMLTVIDGNGIVCDSILLDAAFQCIQASEESGYKAKNMVHEPRTIEHQLDHSARLGRIYCTEGESWSADFSEMMVLGISQDFKYSFCLGFAARESAPVLEVAPVLNTSAEKIIPFIVRVEPDGSEHFFFFAPDTGELESTRATWGLPDEELLEISELLSAAERFNFNFDQSQYSRQQDVSQVIKLRE